MLLFADGNFATAPEGYDYRERRDGGKRKGRRQQVESSSSRPNDVGSMNHRRICGGLSRVVNAKLSAKAKLPRDYPGSKNVENWLDAGFS
jgi:hypothetical protein